MSGSDNNRRVVAVGGVAKEIVRQLGNGGRLVTYKGLAEEIGCAWDSKALAVALGRIQELRAGLGLPCPPAVVVRSDDGMPGEGFYGLYRALFCPELHQRPSELARDVRR